MRVLAGSMNQDRVRLESELIWRIKMKMCTNFALATLAFLPALAFATTPTITSVSGTVQTGQNLTVTGTTMVDHNTTGWDTSAAWNFEGASYSADGWDAAGDNTASCQISYDSSIKLMGSKSIKFRQYGAHSGPGAGACSVAYAPSTGNDFYVSSYVRYDPSAGSDQWPNNFLKLFLTVAGSGNQFYFQPRMNNGNSPVQWEIRDGAVEYNPDIPGGALKSGRWYYVEGRWKNSSPKRLEAWIDGVKVTDEPGVATVLLQYMIIGQINMSATSSSYDMSLNIDRFVVSSSRIYPASMIEIGSSPTYGQGTKLWQEPLYLSDGSIQIKADLTGLGAGPYYLWVTNNRQERSQPYTLGTGGGGDTTPPNAAINAPSSGTAVSGITTVNTTASDNVGITGVQVKVNGNNLGAEDTSAPYSNSWNTTSVSNGTYNLTATARDAAGNTTTSAPVTVTVSNATAAPTVSLTANPASIASGQSSSLTWSSTNATSCTASGGWTGTRTTSGTQSVSPASTMNYTLSCTGTGGTAQQTATVTVSSTPPPTTPTVSLAANPATITVGQSSTLNWSSTNATSCTASGAWTGTKAVSGSQSVSPTTTSTYTLTCTGTGGSAGQNTTITVGSAGSATFFTEGYEDTNFASRGWYDTTTGTLDTTERYSGNSSLRCTYTAGGNNCVAPSRHKFTESDSVYLSYRVKYSSNFVGSGQGYHPHEFLLLTNLNGDYDGLAFDYLTLYLESHWSSSSSGVMQVGFQDGQNIDQSRRGQNLIGVTENRAVAGCNGSPSGYAGDCYNRGDGVYVNGVMLSSSQTFTTANKNNWNHVEAYYRLNSISNGIGQADGIIRVWFNNSLVFERTNAILRTGQRSTMKLNQFIFGPWIGDGSPVTQTMWIDDLVVASERPGSGSALAAPTNLRVAP